MLGLGNVMTGGSPPSEFTIDQVSGLNLWLKFDTGQGTITDGIEWRDSSGNDNHASQTTDAQEGAGFSEGAFVTDSGNQDNLDLTSDIDLTGSYSIFIALDLSEQTNETLLSSVNNASFLRFAQGGTNTKYRMKHSGTATSPLDITITALGLDFCVVCIRRDASNSNRISIRKDGSEIIDPEVTATGAGTFSLEQVGTTSNGATSAKIYEVAVYNEYLSDESATKIEDAIEKRVGL